MNRRNFIATGLALAPALRAGSADAAPRTWMGLAWTSYMMARHVNDALALARIAAELGAAGVQAPIADPSDASVRELRAYLEAHQLYYEGAAGFPMLEADAPAFERQLRAAQAAGARCVRFSSPGGRRYENFHSLEQWREFVPRAHEALRRAVSIAERVRIPLALENHKDWTVDELAGLMKDYSSEFLGVCLDYGNNVSLLDDPYEVVERLAPYTISTHCKDARFGVTADALLLGDVAMGDGVLDLARIFASIAKGGRKPKVSLEMITRAPLRVPVFSSNYWKTFPAREGSRLAALVELGAARPVETQWKVPTAAEHLTMEEANIRRSLAWSVAHADWSV